MKLIEKGAKLNADIERHYGCDVTGDPDFIRFKYIKKHDKSSFNRYVVENFDVRPEVEGSEDDGLIHYNGDYIIVNLEYEVDPNCPVTVKFIKLEE